MDLGDLFPARAGMPAPVADLATLPADVHDLTFNAESRSVERIGSLRDLERIWCLNTRAPFLPAIGSGPRLDSLFLEMLSVDDLDLLRHIETPRVLRLEGGTRVADLDGLREVRGLRGLSVAHFPKVGSLQPLSHLVELEALDVSGSMWKRMKVDSLEPLASLVSLRALSLTSITPADESLRPLAHLSSLRELWLANRYPVEEMARLSAAPPRTNCDWFRAYRSMGQPCEACGASLQMPTGKGKRIFCRECNPGSARRLEKAWDQARTSTF